MNVIHKSLGSVRFFFPKEMYTFIQQGCIKLFKSDSKDIYVRKDLNLKNAVFNKKKLLKLFLLSTNSSILE